jgi:hypothetical protein
LEPLGFIAGALVGAAACGAVLNGRSRQPELAGRLLTLERLMDHRGTELGALGAELGQALREQDGRITELADELEVLNRAMGKTLGGFENQLQGMQEFIVQAAEEARSRREAVTAAPVLQGLSPERGVELNELMRLQREAQQEFAARRRATAAEGFQQPTGGGL